LSENVAQDGDVIEAETRDAFNDMTHSFLTLNVGAAVGSA